MVNERRKAPRANIKERLKIDSSGKDQADVIEAQTLNISKTGALCIINKYIPPFTKLRMTIPLKSGDSENPQSIECESVIVRVEPDDGSQYKIALYFVDMLEKDMNILENFLNEPN